MWLRRSRGGRISYAVNRDHPLIRNALNAPSVTGGELGQILRLVEEYVPVQQIWVDMAEGDESQSQPFEATAEGEVLELIRALYVALTGAGATHDEAMERLVRTEIIGDRFELVEATVRELLEGTGVE